MVASKKITDSKNPHTNEKEQIAGGFHGMWHDFPEHAMNFFKRSYQKFNTYNLLIKKLLTFIIA